ncbi:MAG: YceI family protein [Bacteroidota bacterium]|nr:YceI family protein [Bacteroidota bacterium]
MKIHLLSTALIAAVTLASCGDNANDGTSNAADSTATSAKVATQERNYRIAPAQSSAQWKGVMLGVKQHHGTVNFTEGDLMVTNGQLTGGNFTVDLTTIAPMDSAYAPETDKQGRRTDLIGHLQSADFFDVANHPTAKLRILQANGNTATAELTLRGVTGTETIENIQITENNGELKATGTMKFDRLKYGVKWDSGVQEAVLSNDIELSVDITGREAGI